MNVILWILAGLLAAGFATAGGLKLTQPKDKLLVNMAWVEDFGQGTIRFIGVMELLGAFGLIVPAALASIHR